MAVRGVQLLTRLNNNTNEAQDAVLLLCCKGTLLSHGQLIFHHDPQDLFCKTASSWSVPNPQQFIELFPSRNRTWHFPLLNSMRFLSAHFLLRSLLMTAHFLAYEDIVENNTKRHTKIKINNTHCSLFIHGASHHAVDIYQTGQAQFTLHKSWMSALNNLLVLHFNLCLGNKFPTVEQPQQYFSLQSY